MKSPLHIMPVLGKREQQAKARRKLVDDARALMSENISNGDFNLPDASNALYVSERQLQRAFSQCGSAGFRYELASMRMYRAAMLFREDPTLSVGNAARAVGYNQPPYFAKAFKLHIGTTPMQWRTVCRKRQTT